MSSIEDWKRQMENMKGQLGVLKMYKSNAMKQLSDVIAAQTDKAAKARYREQKVSKQAEWDSKINHIKQQIATLKSSKPSR